MLMFRRVMSLVLVLVMVAGMLPYQTLAMEAETLPATETAIAETETAQAATVETEAPAVTEAVTEPAQEETAAPLEITTSVEYIPAYDAELPESAELQDAYLNRMFYGSDVAFFGINARERLTALEQKVYDYLKVEIQKIAAGERSTTRIEISGTQLAQWGFDVRFDTSSTTNTNDAVEIASEAFYSQLRASELFSALMFDCPYELYWFDKASGFGFGTSYSIYGGETSVSVLRCLFRVVGDLQPAGYDSNNPTIDTSFASTAKASAAAARNVVSKYASYGDYDKLVAYKDEICSLVTYNTAAANSGSFSMDADPWQLIYVFDGNSSTNVVCEGYAKAFQYLVDQSTFQADVESYLVSGLMDGGGHMWNVVSIDGKRYIADVTNSDSGTVGQNGGLFLAGTSGSVKTGYNFLGCSFVYRQSTIDLWGEELLTLEASDYTPGTGAAYIASGTCGENLTWTLDNSGTLTISGSGDMTDYGSFDTPPWYDYEENLKNVVIESGVTSIGNYAFYSMGEMQTIQIPEGVTSIGDFGIAFCGKLQSLWLPDSLTTLGSQVFNSCKSVTEVKLSKNLKELPVNAFGHCTGLTQITLPDGMQTIGTQAFWNATGLISITIPDSVTTLGASAFKGCTALKYVTFEGDAPEFLAYDTVSNFQNVVATVYYPAGNPTWTEEVRQNYGGTLTWVGDCTNGHAVVIVPGVAPTCTEPGLTEGKYCSACGEVMATQQEIPAAGHSYDNGKITQAPTCTNRGWVEYTCTVCGYTMSDEIDSTGHTSEEIIENETAPTCTAAGSFDIVVYCITCGEELSRSTHTIPANGHTPVTDKAVAPTCTETGLTEGSHCSYCRAVLTAQKTVPATGHTPVTDQAVSPTCTEKGLTEGSHCSVCYAVLTAQQEIPANGHSFVNSFCTVCGAPDTLEGSFDGLTWVLDGYGNLTISGSGDMDENPWIDYAERIKTLTVEAGVTTVGYHAFDGCTNLTAVSLPNTITEIDYYAFQNCPGLTEFTVPRRVKTIGSGAFLGCTGLTEMVIPEGVGEVGSWAFEGCTGLVSVTIPSSLSVLESYLFRDCTALTDVYLPEGVTEMWNSVFMGCTSLKRIHLPESLTKMSYSIFDGCTALTEVNIPSGMDVIDDYTFSGCESLTNITIPSSVVIIGRSAFWGSGLTEVTVPASVIQIGVGAFSNCQNLRGITVASKNKEYSNDTLGALYNKNKTVLVQIPGAFTGTFAVPETVKTIGERAVAFCHGVTGITVPQGVTTIENSAFFRSNGLKEIILPDSVELIEKYAFEECAALTSVTVRGACLIRELAFSECYALRDIWFKGDAASFEKYAFNYVTATAHYPAGNPTWTEDVMQSYGGTITWEPQYAVEEVVKLVSDRKDLWPGDTALLTATLDPGARDVEIIWSLEGSADAQAELIPNGLTAQLVCRDVTKRTTVTVTARTAEGSNAPVSVQLTLRPEGLVEADYTIYSGKSLQLTAYDPITGKPYKSKDVLWEVLTWDEAGNMVAADAFASISASGKLTAKKVYETVRLEVSRTVIATGEVVTCLIDILPAVTQAEVISNGEVVNGKTVLVDFTAQSKVFELAVYPEDTVAEVTWTVGDAKKQQYASYIIENDTLTVMNPTGKPGTVTVKAVANAGIKKTVSFKLQFGSYAETVVLMEPSVRSIRGGETLQLFAYISEPSHVTKDGIVWSVSDKNAASISGGKLKAKNVAHPTVVTVTATSKDGQAKASLDFEILPKNEGQLVVKTGETFVTNGTRSLNRGDTLQLEAFSIVRGQSVSERVIWTSNKPAVAVVDENGLVTALGSGTAKITAQARDNRKVTVTVKVTNLVRDMVLTTKDGKNLTEENGETVAVVASGKSINLVAAVFPGGASSKMTWEVVEGSDYVKIASSGKLTANKDLTGAAYALVRATAADGGGCSRTIRVKVLPIAQGLQIFESGIRVRSNTTFVCDMLTTPVLKLSARVYPATAWQKVELTSSNKKIARIDEEGNLVCVKPGTVTITAKALDGSNQKATFKFTVVKMVSGLSLAEGIDLAVIGGKTLKLAPAVVISPSDATNKKLSWSVAPNAHGVTVSSSGVLKTKKVYRPVTVNVMVTTQDGSGKMLSFDVTILPA